MGAHIAYRLIKDTDHKIVALVRAGIPRLQPAGFHGNGGIGLN